MRKITIIQWLPRALLFVLITLYQKTLSPDHGPLRALYPYGFCRHHPTCSEHGKNVIVERGAIIGLFLILRRLLSCHPWRELSDDRISQSITTTASK